MARRKPRRDYEKLATVGKTEEQVQELFEEEIGQGKEFCDQLSYVPADDVVVSNEESGDSPTEEEMIGLEERLKNAHLSREKMVKKERHRRLTMEARDLEEDVRKMKKREQKVTTVALRRMDDVRRKVDRVMDEKLKNMSASSSSSSEDEQSDGSSSGPVISSSEEEDGENKRQNRRGKGKKNGKKLNKNKDEKQHHSKKSGKSKKLTSLVKFPQEWPHSYLGLHFVDQDKTYDSLTMAEFCAGYVSILESIEQERLRKFRLAHLRDIMYLATQYQWQCVLKFHAACLLEVERGNMRWGQSFQVLQNATLAGGFIQNHSSSFGRSGSFSNNNSNSNNFQRSFNNNNQSMRNGERICFCSRFQNGSCSQQSDHNGFLNGESRFLRHICATCWLTNRRRAAHPANSDTCPSRTEPPSESQ